MSRLTPLNRPLPTALFFNNKTLSQVIQATQAANLAAHYRMDETSGTTITDVSGNGYDGVYDSVTLLGSAGVTFDGSTSKGTISNATSGLTLAGTQGAAFIRAKVSAAGVWTDATARYVLRLVFDASNEINILKPTTNDTILVRYRVAGTTYQVTTAITTTEYFTIAFNFADGDQSTPIVQGWLNGTSMGTATPAGTFAGAPVTDAFIGAGDATPSNVWSGTIEEVAIWDGINLTTDEVARLT